MATHSSILAWGIPWTEEGGGATAPGVAQSRARLHDQLVTLGSRGQGQQLRCRGLVSMQHVESSRIWNPHVLHWQAGFFTTEPPGQPFFFFPN